MKEISVHSLEQVVIDTLNSFLDKFIKDPNVHGILLAGSYAYGDPSENSDLDVFIIYKELDWRERGNTWINGYEIEYFINPEKQIYQYMNTEDPFRPNTAHMFANGIILYSKPETDTLANIIAYAKEKLNLPIQPMSDIDKELAKYWLDDIYKDLVDMNVIEDHFSYQVIASEYIQYSINLFFKINKTIKEKTKRLAKQIELIDGNFLEIINEVFNSRYKLNSIETLKNYLESSIGGERSREWKLKTKVTFNKN